MDLKNELVFFFRIKVKIYVTEGALLYMDSVNGHSIERIDNGHQKYFECVRCGLTASSREDLIQKTRSVPCTSMINRF